MSSFSASDAALEGFQVIRTQWRVALGWCLFSIVGFVGLVILAFFAILAASFAVTSRDQAGTAGSVIGAFSRLGAFCLVNRGATIGHHASIGEFASIGPGANLASGAVIGRAAAVGIGAAVLNHVNVGARAFVTAGAIVTRDVEPGTRVAGFPARRVKSSPPAGGA